VKKPNQFDNLFSEFSPISRTEWENQIKKDLNGADYKSKLKWNTLEGINPMPFYLREDLPGSVTTYTTGTGLTSWQKCEAVYETDPDKIFDFIKKAIDSGASSVMISQDITAGDQTLGGNITGAQIQTQDDFDSVFEKLDLSDIHVIFNSGMATPGLLAMYLNHTRKFGSVTFLYDPVTYIAKHGRFPATHEEMSQIISQMADVKNVRTLSANGLFYHNAGATIVQEIAIILAIASEYFAAIDESERESAAKSFTAIVSSGPLYFPEIAKLKSLRLLWKNLLSAYSIVSSIPLFIHAETTPQNKTVTDPYNNLLRATTEAMASVIGGADSLCILPFDATFKKPDSFSKRIARNVHHIFSEEAHLDKVSNAAQGSYYLENLTEQIAKEAWEFFTMIEKQGGIIKALKNGVLQSAIEKSKETKLNAYFTRKRILTGTNQYPDPKEELPDSLQWSRTVNALHYSKTKTQVDQHRLISSIKDHLIKGGTLGDLSESFLNPQKALYRTLEEFNAGKPFDELRLKTERFAKESGRKPSVLITEIGDPKWRKARSSFAINLFGCAGFDINTSTGFNSFEEISGQTNPGQYDIFVLCSSDKEYLQLCKPFGEALMKNGILVIAGDPGENEVLFKSTGIDYFIFSGMNVVTFLSSIQEEVFKKEALS
jgi:methylmalonyl-CoA mutase